MGGDSVATEFHSFFVNVFFLFALVPIAELEWFLPSRKRNQRDTKGDRKALYT